MNQLTLSGWHWLVIGLGGALGATGRFAVLNLINRLHSSPIPWGTFAVNVFGSFVMGLVFVFFFLKYPNTSGMLRSFIVTGLLGAFTTFSSFAIELLVLLTQQQSFLALFYMFASVAMCLLACTLGYAAGKLII